MNPKEEKVNVCRSYKDNLFRMVFREKEELISLYNAVNETDYSNPDDLTVNTLENAIYMNMKNDLSFLIDDRMNVYEQQSTFCPNMPLRDLMYVGRLYEKEMKDANAYSSRQIKIPAPKFLVFYNGKKDLPERQILKLSDAYKIRQEDPELELKVTMLNINAGKNRELLDKCKTLKDYVTFVEKVREYGMTIPLQEAVERAVQECIRDDVLSAFLKKYRAEAVSMTIFEYDQEAHMKLLAEESREEGREEGRRAGREEERKNTERERQNTERERKRAEAAEEENKELRKQLALLEKQKN